MGKALFIITTFVACMCLSGCSTPEKKNIEEYIRSHYDGESINELKIVEISEGKDMYDPKKDLKSLQVKILSAKSDMVKLRKEAWESKDKKTTLSLLRRATESFNSLTIGGEIER